MRLSRGLIGIAALSLALGACSSTPDPQPTTSTTAAASASSTGQWPRTIEHAGGTTELKEQPKKIVSTSVVLTGSLLSLDAPVVGTAAGKPGADGYDDEGFFTHWSKVAKDKGVKPLYNTTELDMEAVAAAEPDLIVISASGRDSTADAQAELEKIAPVISINYNKEEWQQVERELATATGTEEQAEKNIADYDQALEKAKESIKPPADPVQAVVYSPKNEGLNFALATGPHVEILKKLGFTYDTTDFASMADSERGGNRSDFAFLSPENSVKALTAKNVLFVGNTDKDIEAFKANPVYSSLPVVKDSTLVALGKPSFKLDYYSALDMIEHLQKAYAQ